MTTQPCADILARVVSIFAGSTHTLPAETVPLADVLRHIQDGTYRTAVASLRHLLARGDHERYRLAKEQSLAFTPCCALQTRHTRRAFREDHKRVLGAIHHYIEDLTDITIRDLLMVQVGHAIHKNTAGNFQSVRFAKFMGLELHIHCRITMGPRQRCMAEAKAQSLGITFFAPAGQTRAAQHGVPNFSAPSLCSCLASDLLSVPAFFAISLTPL